MEDKKLAQAKRRSIRRQRFRAGLREITIYHRGKALIPLAYLLLLAWVWGKRAKILMPISGDSGLLYHGLSLALLFVGWLALWRLSSLLVHPGEPQSSRLHWWRRVL